MLQATLIPHYRRKDLFPSPQERLLLPDVSPLRKLLQFPGNTCLSVSHSSLCSVTHLYMTGVKIQPPFFNLKQLEGSSQILLLCHTFWWLIPRRHKTDSHLLGFPDPNSQHAMSASYLPNPIPSVFPALPPLKTSPPPSDTMTALISTYR